MSTNEGAIIFFRVWNPSLIQIALKSAMAACPWRRVVHLHCQESSVGWIDSYNVSDSFNSAWQELSVFNDSIFGPNCVIHEKVCIARWKVLLDWMESHNVGEVCFCDSDVMMFSDPFATPHYECGKLAVSDNHHGCVHAGNAIVQTDAVREFWSNAKEYLSDPIHQSGPVNDLVIWTEVALRRGFSDQNRIINGVAWDHHMGCVGEHEGGWEEDQEFPGYKLIRWMEGTPYCMNTTHGSLVRLVNLHCWGNAETKMPDYASAAGIL